MALYLPCVCIFTRFSSPSRSIKIAAVALNSAAYKITAKFDSR